MFPEPPSKYFLAFALLALIAIGARADLASQDAKDAAATAASITDAQQQARSDQRFEAAQVAMRSGYDSP